MMLFLTLVFLFTSTYALIKGKLFYDLILEAANADIKKSRGEIKEIPKETAVKVATMGGYMLAYILIQLIYIINAIHHDPHMIPTLCILGYIFLSYVFSLTRKGRDLTTEEGRAKYLVKNSKRYTAYGILSKLIFISYFVYMFLVLVGLIK